MELWRRLALDPAAHRLVTLVGGGGKTTLLYALARQAVDAGYTGTEAAFYAALAQIHA